MLDFIKNNKFIAGAITAVVIIIALILTLLLSGGGVGDTGGTTQPFPETGETQQTTLPVDSGESSFLFGTSSERFVSSGTTGTSVPDFRAVTKLPVSSATLFERLENDSMVEYIRYTSRIDGHIFDIPLTKYGTEALVSNKTILRIGNSKWSTNASSTLVRYFDEDGTQINAYLSYTTAGTPTSQENGFTGRPITQTIQDLAFSPTGSEYFYLVSTQIGSFGYIENVVTGAREQVWSSALRGLTVSWENQDKILIYSNPSSISAGAVWILDPKTKNANVLLANSTALAAKGNPSGAKILYSVQEKENEIFSLRILDIATGHTNHLPLATIIEKCAWGPKLSKYVYCAIPRNELSGSMLEDWYLGTISSDDQVWRLDTETGVVKRLIDPKEETGEKFDIIDITVSPQEDFVVFRTRVNNILWALKLPVTTVEESQELSSANESLD